MVSVFLLWLDSMKVWKVLERERVVERRFWLGRGSNLWGVVLVSIYRERRNGKKWEEWGLHGKWGLRKKKIITCWVQKANERNTEMKQCGLIYADGYSFILLEGVNCGKRGTGSTTRLLTSTVGLTFVFG